MPFISNRYYIFVYILHIVTCFNFLTKLFIREIGASIWANITFAC